MTSQTSVQCLSVDGSLNQYHKTVCSVKLAKKKKEGIHEFILSV